MSIDSHFQRKRSLKLKKHDSAVAALQERIKVAKAKSPGVQATGVLAVKDVPGIVVDDVKAMKVGEWKDSTHFLVEANAGQRRIDDRVA